jgi:hypothetical protein
MCPPPLQMAALDRKTAGRRPQYVEPHSTLCAEAAYTAAQNRKRSPRGSQQQREFHAERAALHAGSNARPASAFPPVVRAPELLPTATQEAASPPVYIHPFQEVRAGQDMVSQDGREVLLQVRLASDEDAQSLVALCHDGLDGRRLPRAPQEGGECGPAAWGGIRNARNTGTCELYVCCGACEL